MELSPHALRILGALVEKELATPQGYPLSLNALRIAANQSTARDPVTDYDEQVVREAVRELTTAGLVRTSYAPRSNTPKYGHVLDEHLEVDRSATAVLSVLMLRGPQTVGEIRQRTERMHAFAELSDVVDVLESLRDHPYGALAAEVPRQPGQKEGRWQHLLGPVAAAGAGGAELGVGTGARTADVPAVEAALAPAGGADGLADLRLEVAELRDDLDTALAEIERLRRLVGG